MTFQLQIATPDGLIFDGEAERVVTRTTEGDVGIMARHSDFVAPLGVGRTRVKLPDGSVRLGSSNRGMITVNGGIVRIVAVTFEWADEIDVERAQRAAEKARERMNRQRDDRELRLAEYKLRRALNRIDVYNSK